MSKINPLTALDAPLVVEKASSSLNSKIVGEPDAHLDRRACAYIERTVAAAPPLTLAQRARLAQLLNQLTPQQPARLPSLIADR